MESRIEHEAVHVGLKVCFIDHKGKDLGTMQVPKLPERDEMFYVGPKDKDEATVMLPATHVRIVATELDFLRFCRSSTSVRVFSSEEVWFITSRDTTKAWFLPMSSGEHYDHVVSEIIESMDDGKYPSQQDAMIEVQLGGVVPDHWEIKDRLSFGC